MNNYIIHHRTSKIVRAIVVLMISLVAYHVQAQTATPSAEKKRLCVGPITAIKASKDKAMRNGKVEQLDQVLQTLDTTLIDQVNSSRKFEVVARKDSLKSLLNEQDFGASGNVDPSTAAQALKIAGAQYLVLTTITDFTMGREAIKFEGVGASADREAVRVSCSVQIYDTTTGKLIESARFRGQDSSTGRSGNATDEGITLTKATDRLAAEIFNRICDVIYPAKVVAKLGTQITINRGDNAGIAVGQVWSVYALGEEIVDPDTGEKLGRNEAEVGRIKITRITPKLSYGDAVEDNGIVTGAIVRPKESTPVVSDETAKPKPPAQISDKVKDDL
ncbi:MAG: CsgG/HfaB family protein [Verrucomicrobiota bacterium]